MRTLFSCILIFAFGFTWAQKTLQIQAAIPEVLRNGDRMELQLTIRNTASKEQTGQAELQLTDAVTGVSIDGWFQNVFPNQYFTAEAKQATVASFPIEVPFLFFKKAAWRFIVRTPSDSVVTSGIFPVLPVLQPFSKTALFNGSGTFSFIPLAEGSASDSRQHAALQVQMTASAAAFGYADMARLLEGEAIVASDVSAHLYAANTLLQLNRDNPEAYRMLKAPGVMQLQEQTAGLTNQLLALQQANGGFAPLVGGKPGIATTWQVALQLARLKQSGTALPANLQLALSKAIAYFSRTKHTLPAVAIAYLETTAGLSSSSAKEQMWVTAALGQQPRWIQAMTAVLLYRLGNKEQAARVFQLAQKEPAHTDQEISDLLPAAAASYLLLEYAQLSGDSAAIREYTSKALQQDQPNKADIAGTAYALLLGGRSLDRLPPASVQLGNLSERAAQQGVLSDTTIEGGLVHPALGKITIRQQGNGALYTRVVWRYFDEPDTIPANNIKLTRSWNLVQAGKSHPLTEGLRLTAGNQLEMVLEVELQEPLRNMRLEAGIPAGCTSLSRTVGNPTAPVYQTPGFINWIIPTLAPGRHRFSYRLQVTHKGSFATGPVVLQAANGEKVMGRIGSEGVWVE